MLTVLKGPPVLMVLKAPPVLMVLKAPLVPMVPKGSPVPTVLMAPKAPPVPKVSKAPKGPEGQEGLEGLEGPEGQEGPEGLEGAPGVDGVDGSDSLWIASDPEMYYDGGNVGIGNDAPDGLLHVSGPIRMGSEAGTTQGASGNIAYQGIVLRRAVTSNNNDGNIVARTDIMRLERDGTSGGFVLRWGATQNAVLNGTGYAIDTGGNMTGIRVQAVNEVDGGERQVIDDADNQVFLHLTFGNFHGTGHTCEVTLTRSLSNQSSWVGTLTSTYDQ